MLQLAGNCEGLGKVNLVRLANPVRLDLLLGPAQLTFTRQTHPVRSLSNQSPPSFAHKPPQIVHKYSEGPFLDLKNVENLAKRVHAKNGPSMRISVTSLISNKILDM